MTVQSTELVSETPYIWRARQPGSRHRLICFPHAGAGATTYAEWAPALPAEIELVAVQLPGRQNRIAEEPFTEVGPLVSVLTHALRPVLSGSFSFFGHSCGAALAFELAKALRAETSGSGAAVPLRPARPGRDRDPASARPPRGRVPCRDGRTRRHRRGDRR